MCICGSGSESLPMQPTTEHEVLDHILRTALLLCKILPVYGSMVESQMWRIHRKLVLNEKVSYLSMMKRHLVDGALCEEGSSDGLTMSKFNRYLRSYDCYIHGSPTKFFCNRI
ncbi:unnamed protein product [Arabis nemorensis]|uniref:Uncharacterized protein n=1 Tax=Arabis nemorensis TaxID=586526 RepID=A0A565CTV9_9BRAS|nr:unnamed protein product [Arabis nemorensis]